MTRPQCKIRNILYVQSIKSVRYIIIKRKQISCKIVLTSRDRHLPIPAIYKLEPFTSLRFLRKQEQVWALEQVLGEPVRDLQVGVPAVVVQLTFPVVGLDTVIVIVAWRLVVTYCEKKLSLYPPPKRSFKEQGMSVRPRVRPCVWIVCFNT